jgi:signal transduction histidine kinase
MRPPHPSQVPKGMAQDLFLPFEQQGSDPTGVELGLPISRKSVEAHGGSIYVREKAGGSQLVRRIPT